MIQKAPGVTKGCLLEVRGAQLLHSLDGTKHHPVERDPWHICSELEDPGI